MTAPVPEKTDFERLALEAVVNMPSCRGIATWLALRGARKYPTREELKPRDVAGIMQHMSIVRVIDKGADFENRFVGDAVVRAHEVPIANRRFSEVAYDAPVLMRSLLPLFRFVVDSGEPVAYRGATGHDMAHVVYSDFEGVLLPLGRDCVDHVLYVGICTIKVTQPSHAA